MAKNAKLKALKARAAVSHARDAARAADYNFGGLVAAAQLYRIHMKTSTPGGVDRILSEALDELRACKAAAKAAEIGDCQHASAHCAEAWARRKEAKTLVEEVKRRWPWDQRRAWVGAARAPSIDRGCW